MSELNQPAIILKTDFKIGSPKGKSYSKFVDYISTEKNGHDVTKQEVKTDKLFQNYLEYMSIDRLKSDPNYNKENVMKRTTSSFNDAEFLDEDKMNILKEKFKNSDENSRIMYQDIISFDNQFLIENGLFNEETDKLDESKIKKATRRMMHQMIKDNRMDENKTFWCANIHYDTDNIHIHIASSEEENTRKTISNGKYKGQYKGKRASKTLKNMKSTFANSIDQDIGLMKEFDELKKDIKEDIKDRMKKSKLDIHSVKHIFKQKKDYNDLVKRLPPTNQSWSYNSDKIKAIQPEIDQYIENYIAPYYKEDKEKVEEILDKQTSNYKKLYGENSRYEDYKENKKERLKSDVGNTFLRELKTIEKEKQQEMYYNKERNNKNSQSNKKSVRNIKQAMREFKKSAYQLSKKTAKRRDSYIHELEHQKLESNIQQNLKEQEEQMDMNK